MTRKPLKAAGRGKQLKNINHNKQSRESMFKLLLIVWAVSATLAVFVMFYFGYGHELLGLLRELVLFLWEVKGAVAELFLDIWVALRKVQKLRQ